MLSNRSKNQEVENLVERLEDAFTKISGLENYDKLPSSKLGFESIKTAISTQILIFKRLKDPQHILLNKKNANEKIDFSCDPHFQILFTSPFLVNKRDISEIIIDHNDYIDQLSSLENLNDSVLKILPNCKINIFNQENLNHMNLQTKARLCIDIMSESISELKGNDVSQIRICAEMLTEAITFKGELEGITHELLRIDKPTSYTENLPMLRTSLNAKLSETCSRVEIWYNDLVRYVNSFNLEESEIANNKRKEIDKIKKSIDSKEMDFDTVLTRGTKVTTLVRNILTSFKIIAIDLNS